MSLPVVLRWTGTRREFVLCFGLALFVFTGLFGMGQAFWLPLSIRLIHTLELFADAMAYACVPAALFGGFGTRAQESSQRASVPAPAEEIR